MDFATASGAGAAGDSGIELSASEGVSSGGASPPLPDCMETPRKEEPTQASEPARSGWMRFLDTFFQEQNIQWILGVGMLVLLGSSLMLVTSHWASYTPVWKHLILLGYTVGLHFAGQIAYHSLGLRKTGAGLMLLTVMLIPLSFLAMRWIHPEESVTLAGLVHNASLVGLLAANTAFAVPAAIRIFRHFLRRTQPTFVASYLVLSLAGAVVPALPAVAAPFAAMVLWFVFAAGAIKVNRHVFWLTEERRLPRIVGFLPILLLGGQFLTLFLLGLASHLRMEWIGLGCVLTAIPVLLTADTLARVFLEMHGQVTRPLPWSIVVPMFVGLSLTLAGVCLAGLRFPEAPVLVPTAALAAVMVGVVAHRTGKKAFVWAMLAGVVMAYQCSPVFFREFARYVVSEGAAAVHESRLPLAFYGLTYLPLLLVTTLLAARGWRRGEGLFAPVLLQFSLGLPVLLLAASVSHSKAMLPVAVVLTALFGLQTILLRDRRLLALASAGWMVAAVGFTPFVVDVLGWSRTVELPLLAWAVAGGLLLVPGAIFDRRTRAWLESERREAAPNICEAASLLSILAAAAGWLIQAMTLPAASGAAPVAGALIALLLLIHTARWRRPALGEVAVSFAIVVPVVLTVSMGWALVDTITLATVLLATAWVVPVVLRRRPESIACVAFADAAERVAGSGMALLFLWYLVPMWGSSVLFGSAFHAWIVASLVTLWAFDAARRLEAGWLVAVGWVAVLATEAAAAMTAGIADAEHWLPAVWGATALTLIPALRLCDRRSTEGTDSTNGGLLVTSFSRCALVTLSLIAVASLVEFSLPFRVAGGISLAGLLLFAALWRNSTMRTLSLVLVNWQVLCGLVQVFAPGLHGLAEMSLAAFQPAALPVALAAAVLALAWHRGLRNSNDLREVMIVQRAALQVACAGSLLSTLARVPDSLTAIEILLVVGTFTVLVADRLIAALRYSAESLSVLGDKRKQDELRFYGEASVWMAELLVAACIGYLAVFEVITFGHGMSMFCVLGAGLAAWAIARWAARSPRTDVLVAPLTTTGFCLPAVTVLLGIGRHVAVADPAWLGMNSLALLLAAGFYFWQGLERNEAGLLVGSSVILNVALALLWRELDWSDPQFFLIPLGISILGLVELLREEIPPKLLDPLRYAGALVILVSPTFHIVGGSWLHLFSLMVVSVGITLTAMGLRIRALMYTGTAFLVADLVAMVVRGSIDRPSLLWIAGIVLGLAIIGLAAYCERHRERMLQRLRLLAAELETWQ